MVNFSCLLKSLCSIITLLFFAVTSYAVPTEVFVYADSNFEPYSYQYNGMWKPQGETVSFLAGVFADMHDYKVNVVGMPKQYGLKRMVKVEGLGFFPVRLMDIPLGVESVALGDELYIIFSNHPERDKFVTDFQEQLELRE